MKLTERNTMKNKLCVCDATTFFTLFIALRLAVNFLS